VKFLQAIAAIDQLAGEPVQQLAVDRHAAAEAQVVGRLHQAAAEMIVPEAIDDRAGKRRVLLVAINPASLTRLAFGRVGGRPKSLAEA
jgi:hypothetical protein